MRPWKGVRVHNRALLGVRLAMLASAALLIGSVDTALAQAPTTPGALTIAPGIDQAFQAAQAEGVPLDTSAAALGDPSNPTQADLVRDFAPVGWPTSELPPVAALADQRVRELLALLHAPGAKTGTAQVQVGAPGQAGSGAGATPTATATSRPPNAHAAQSQLQVATCGVAMVTEPGETTQAAAFFDCPIDESAEDEFEWFSQYTGNPLNWLDIFFDRYVTGPLVDWVFGEPPATSFAIDESNEESGQDGHRHVWWWIKLCARTCGIGVLNVYNT